MGLPGHRRTSSHKRRRAAHFALKKIHLSKCSHCSSLVKSHRVCMNCGYYNGRQVIKVKSKIKAGAKKTSQEKETKKETKTEK